MPQSEPRRARSLQEFGAIGQKLFVGPEIGASIAAYRPRPTDVIISPFAKCGTTWLQQIFHTLRTGGDMDFVDVSEVVPWIETSGSLGVDLEAPQRAEPRGFKSHLGYDDMPKGAKYIVAFRDPKDALVSFYRFMEGWMFEPGAIALPEFALTRLPQGDDDTHNYWAHLLSWWAQRDNPDVLLMSYEQMTAEPEASICKVATFCGLPLDEARLALTLERSSIDYMLAHKNRFDDTMMRTLSEVRCNVPPGGDSAKVRKGGVGGHRQEMTPDLAALWDAQWTRLVSPVTGFADYADFEAAVRARG